METSVCYMDPSFYRWTWWCWDWDRDYAGRLCGTVAVLGLVIEWTIP